MNEIHSKKIALKNFMHSDSNDGFRAAYGVQVHDKLVSEIKKIPEVEIIYLSMKGIDVVDASFCREAIVRTISEFRSEIGFCLVDIDNEEYLDNFVAGAIKLSQPIFFKLGSGYQIIGPSYPNGPSKGSQEILNYISSHKITSATMLKSDLNLTITNASTKLKQLLNQGYLLRKQEIAASGGLEYLYFPIR